MGYLTVTLEACGLAVFAGGLIAGSYGRLRLMWRLFLAGNTADIAGDVITRSWALLTLSGLLAAFSAWMLWRGLRLMASVVRMIPGRWPRPFWNRTPAPMPGGWAAWCAPGREAEAAEILASRGITVTGITGHPSIPDDGEVFLVSPDSGFGPGYGSISP